MYENVMNVIQKMNQLMNDLRVQCWTSPFLKVLTSVRLVSKRREKPQLTLDQYNDVMHL